MVFNDLITTSYDRYIFLDPITEIFENLFKVDDEMIRIATVLFGQYPIALIHRHVLKTTQQRHLFSLCIGLFLAFFCFRWDALHFFFSSLVIYLICWKVPTKHITTAAFIFSFAYLSVGHFNRQYYQYLKYTLNWSTTQMLLLIKLTSFACSFADGHSEKPIDRRKGYHIKELPSLFHYFSYIFFSPGFTSGPVGEYKEYMNFTDRTAFPNGEIPPSHVPAIKKFVMSIIALVGFFCHKLVPESYTGTEEFLNEGFLYRIGYLMLAVEIGFNKYYYAWFSGEAAVTLIGYSYNGTDKETNENKWDRVNMLNFVPFKLTHNRFGIPNEWNICTAKWLRYHVYYRIPDAFKSQSQVFVHLLSAFWHGFYPGYYIFFLSLEFYRRTEEAFEKAILIPFKVLKKEKRRLLPNDPLKYKIYIVLSTIFTYAYIQYITCPFRLLSHNGGFVCLYSWYFLPYIILIVIYALSTYILRKPKPADVKDNLSASSVKTKSN
eukprot:TRINITY_DN5556_c0_g1_i1.p1 TRINITY_DN5556_c0_g1~~TRINITY_DN5556_c0_g1_i1.p1  ORF type:complete len:491 (+),score=79.77 TRINITY_DN5556_c0_g1_i1:91-1563(+)